jgi:hypothetical protein
MENSTSLIEKQIASVQIYWTKDYGQFKFLRGNRDLNEPKIKRIVKSVLGGLEFFQFCPIMVNEDMYIIDGQHRFVVCKQLRRNIYYVIVPDFKLRQIAEINNNTSKWKERDYLNCYTDVGLEDYKVLDEFAGKYSISIKVAASLLMQGKAQTGGQGDGKDFFRDGEFKVYFLEKATLLMDMVTEFNEFCTTFNTRSFIKAIETLHDCEKYDHTEFTEKLRLHNLTIEPKSTAKEYLIHMEELFNFKNSKRKTIY